MLLNWSQLSAFYSNAYKEIEIGHLRDSTRTDSDYDRSGLIVGFVVVIKFEDGRMDLFLNRLSCGMNDGGRIGANLRNATTTFWYIITIWQTHNI